MVISSQNKNKKETADDHIIKGFYIEGWKCKTAAIFIKIFHNAAVNHTSKQEFNHQSLPSLWEIYEVGDFVLEQEFLSPTSL